MPNLNVGLSLAMLAFSAGATSTSYPVSCFVSEGLYGADDDANCSQVSSYINCGNNGTFVDCYTCNSGCTRTLKTQTIDYESFQYYACENCGTIIPIIVTCPLECTSEDWTSNGTGKQIRCVKGTRSASCEYRCAANFYGDGTTCTACPRYNGVSGTCAAGSTSVSSCCIASGTSISFSDTKGSGTEKLTAQCCAS
ncbi:MAG: hypothetical protein IJ273_01270 [Alphaproteobacteria bacterium]|nr:hypothetical protein [Alphaproteobacteria bacterium]